HSSDDLQPLFLAPQLLRYTRPIELQLWPGEPRWQTYSLPRFPYVQPFGATLRPPFPLVRRMLSLLWHWIIIAFLAFRHQLTHVLLQLYSNYAETKLWG